MDDPPNWWQLVGEKFIVTNNDNNELQLVAYRVLVASLFISRCQGPGSRTQWLSSAWKRNSAAKPAVCCLPVFWIHEFVLAFMSIKMSWKNNWSLETSPVSKAPALTFDQPILVVGQLRNVYRSSVSAQTKATQQKFLNGLATPTLNFNYRTIAVVLRFIPKINQRFMTCSNCLNTFGPNVPQFLQHRLQQVRNHELLTVYWSMIDSYDVHS